MVFRVLPDRPIGVSKLQIFHLPPSIFVLWCDANCNKRTACYMARLIKGLSSQYFEDICVLLIGGVCGKCPLNTTRTVLSCGPNCNKRTACYMARLVKRLSSQYFEDICVLLIGGVCRRCPLNTTRTVLSCGPYSVRGQRVT